MSIPDIRTKRVPIELRRLKASFANHGITCKPKIDEDLTQLLAILPGPTDTPYENGKFEITVEFTEQYPFRPPVIKFATPIYHPNIDNTGNICLDILRMPPTGSYNPALTLESILLHIQVLLASPNPDDPLQSNVADVYKYDKNEFKRKATEHTAKYAVPSDCQESETKRMKTV